MSSGYDPKTVKEALLIGLNSIKESVNLVCVGVEESMELADKGYLEQMEHEVTNMKSQPILDQSRKGMVDCGMSEQEADEMVELYTSTGDALLEQLNTLKLKIEEAQKCEK